MTLGALGEALGAELRGDVNTQIERVATLGTAGSGAVSFLSNRRYRPQLRNTRASAVILSQEFAAECPVPVLVMDNPYLGYARAAALLNPRPPDPRGIHERAVVASDARVHEESWVDAGAVVQAGVRIAARAFIGPGCVVGEGVTVGEDTRLVANVTLCQGVVLGCRVIVHPGVVIGADGFGIANHEGIWEKVPQLGSVRIGDDVEIGANTTIDRGALEDTVVEEGVKLDNLIQVGHNVRIGAHTAIAACVAIGGSARIGRRCTIGGAASLAGHLTQRHPHAPAR